jgi:nuclear pore complex protein Nup107
MLKSVFQYIRRGQLQKAIDLCQSCDQPWRAASLRGGNLGIDSFLDSDGTSDTRPLGNPNRMLWKYTCYKLALNTTDPFEKATYASFAGDLDSMTPALQTWEDYVWAYYNVVVEHEMDRQIKERSKTEYTYPTLQVELPTFQTDEPGFFDSLMTHEKEAIRYRSFKTEQRQTTPLGLYRHTSFLILSLPFSIISVASLICPTLSRHRKAC